jgi:hypothetical protein
MSQGSKNAAPATTFQCLASVFPWAIIRMPLCFIPLSLNGLKCYQLIHEYFKNSSKTHRLFGMCYILRFNIVYCCILHLPIAIMPVCNNHHDMVFWLPCSIFNILSQLPCLHQFQLGFVKTASPTCSLPVYLHVRLSLVHCKFLKYARANVCHLSRVCY